MPKCANGPHSNCTVSRIEECSDFFQGIVVDYRRIDLANKLRKFFCSDVISRPRCHDQLRKRVGLDLGADSASGADIIITKVNSDTVSLTRFSVQRSYF